MKKNCTKRIASLVMVLAMLLSYIPGAVWAVDASTDIKAIEKPTGISIVEDYDDYVGDNWLEMLGLPGTVTVTLANNTKQEVPVAWDIGKLDTRTPGYYSLPGTISLPAGATNGLNLKATITIQVREVKNLINNGDFEGGSSGWKGWTLAAASDPINSSNKVLFAKTSALKTNSGGGQIIFQRDAAAINSLVDAFTREGAGQYYLAVDAMSAPYDASTPARADIDTWINLRYNTNGSDKNTLVGGTTERIRLSTTKWTTISTIVDMQDTWNWLRTDVVCKAGAAAPGGVYLDNFKLIPLKLPLKVEPSAVEEIKTELLSRAVVLNYPDYVGENWKDELDLPKYVQVLTDNGSVADVEVTWSYAGLDFSKYGKYTLVGKLDDSSFPNPKELTVQQTIYVTKPQNVIINGDFNNGASGWKGWTLQGVTDPADAMNNVLFAKTSALKTGSGGGQIIFQKDDATIKALVNAVAKAGFGQYYFSIDAKSAPYDAETSARTDIVAWLNFRFNTNGTGSGTTVASTTDRVPLSTTEWKTLSTTVRMSEVWNWMRTDVLCMGETATEGAVYLDNFQLFPLNVTIAKGQEPADIEEVITEVPVRAVVKDYNKYVGAAWQAALGLPAQVEVRTANGSTASVDVTWNYEPLNLSKVGKYILFGTLDNSTYPNPKELYVTQVIYIREYKNLIPNPGFESGTEGWYLKGTGYGRVTDPIKGGQYAGVTGTFTPRGTLDESLVDTRNMTEAIGEAVALQGAGQYYYSLWARTTGKTLPEGMRLQTRFLYKTKDAATGELSDSTTIKSIMSAASNKAFVQSSNIVEMPENVGWVRLDLYYIATAAEHFNNFGTYVDNAELIPLNILVDRYEGEAEQVETIIPTRQIIQNYDTYIGKGYTVADLLLPETVDVRSTTGQIVRVGVNWNYDSLDLSKLGTYTLTGTLEEIRLDNPKALTVKQTIKVVSYKNLVTNGSFEDFGDNWLMSVNSKSELGIMSPVKDGKLALQMIMGRLDGYTMENVQSMWLEDVYPMGLRITASGAGRYYVGGWGHGTSTSADMQFYTRLWYRSYANGDSSLSNVMSDLKLPTSIGTASTIKWTSSNESVITNDGKVTMGRVPQTVTMTATITYKGKETVKKFMVTVPRNPDLPTFSGSLTGSQEARIGDEVSVTIKLSAQNATSFNAYRFALSYNVTRLEYVGISDSAATVNAENGRITISGIGAERPITDTITVTFKVLKSGVTEVKLVLMEMDIDPNASLDNLPTMVITEGAAVIDVKKSEGDKNNNSSTDNSEMNNSEKDNSVVIWIVIGLVGAALIAGGVIVIILIKKKKQLPPATEE